MFLDVEKRLTKAKFWQVCGPSRSCWCWSCPKPSVMGIKDVILSPAWVLAWCRSSRPCFQDKVTSVIKTPWMARFWVCLSLSTSSPATGVWSIQKARMHCGSSSEILMWVGWGGLRELEPVLWVWTRNSMKLPCGFGVEVWSASWGAECDYGMKFMVKPAPLAFLVLH